MGEKTINKAIIVSTGIPLRFLSGDPLLRNRGVGERNRQAQGVLKLGQHRFQAMLAFHPVGEKLLKQVVKLWSVIEME